MRRILLSATLVAATSTALALDIAVTKERATAGDPEAAHQLCYAYTQGAGVRKNYRKAFPWCGLGAKAGISSSQTLLAEMYFLGFYVPKDEKMAERWYRTAAENGHIHAQYMLGHMALLRAESSQDVDEMCLWLGTAAAAGYERASQELTEVERMWKLAPENLNGRALCKLPD